MFGFGISIALADFLKQQLPYLLSPLNTEASDIPAFDLFDEFARGRHTISSLSRFLKRQTFHVNVAKSELLLREITNDTEKFAFGNINVERLAFQEFRHYANSKGVDVPQSHRRMGVWQRRQARKPVSPIALEGS
ncbi:Uncharacterized protein PBTT_05057 [Plasmodiophora brassicae]